MSINSSSNKTQVCFFNMVSSEEDDSQIQCLVNAVIKCAMRFQVIVDMTFGAGGHTKALLKECPGIRLFGLDRDPLAHRLATKLASEW